MLQWGRSLSTAELRTQTAYCRAMKTLQWGRSLSTAEFDSGHLRCWGWLCASMGPQSFDCGIRMADSREVARKLASMGPQSFDCGIAPLLTCSSSTAGELLCEWFISFRIQQNKYAPLQAEVARHQRASSDSTAHRHPAARIRLECQRSPAFLSSHYTT